MQYCGVFGSLALFLAMSLVFFGDPHSFVLAAVYSFIDYGVEFVPGMHVGDGIFDDLDGCIHAFRLSFSVPMCKESVLHAVEFSRGLGRAQHDRQVR